MEEPIVSFLYKLRIGEYWYAGSGTEGVGKRVKGHYETSVLCPNRKLYKHIADNGGWPAVKMEILSTSSTMNRDQLKVAENELINLKDPHCLNTHRASTTDEEKKKFNEYPSYKAKKAKYQERKKDPVKWAEDQKKRKELYDERKKNPEWVAAENARKSEYKRRDREKKKSKRAAEIAGVTESDK
jgi:hypothetical protein